MERFRPELGGFDDLDRSAMRRWGKSLAVAVGVSCTVLLVPSAPAAADPLGKLPVPAVEVTHSDRSLRDSLREVVVLTRTSAGPRLRKFRTASAADAKKLAQALNRRPGVVATRNSTLRATTTALENEPDGPQQSDMLMIGAPAAWPISEGAGVTVAVLDTGVDSTNPDLAGRVLPELDMLPEVSPTPDANGHGTMVASIIAAGLNGYGIAGVAPEATILPVAALDTMGYGDVATVASAIIAAADAGARVINMSLGGPDRDKVLDAACSYAHAKGSVLVAAAGNSRATDNAVQYPAASPFVVAVASVDSNGNPSNFSNTGRHIDIAAPGEGILGAVPGGDVGTMDGTSAAAPHVSGTLALAAAANPALSADELIDSVLGSAVDDASGDGKDKRRGFGLVRSDLAVARAQAITPPPVGYSGVRRINKVDAAPEPIRRGGQLTLIARLTALYLDNVWRADPGGTQVIFEFKASGKRRYETVATTSTTAGGYAAMQVPAVKSGRWRARVLLTDGTQAIAHNDYVKVRR
jgi:subtilisin family serine protease